MQKKWEAKCWLSSKYRDDAVSSLARQAKKEIQKSKVKQAATLVTLLSLVLVDLEMLEEAFDSSNA